MNDFEKMKNIEIFLKNELDDYDLKFMIELDDDNLFIAKIFFKHDEEITKEITFSFNKYEHLQVEVGEDIFEAVNNYDWTVKYFWMAFMEWPI